MKEGIEPDKLQSWNWRVVKDVKFATHDGIDPTIPFPEISKARKDLKLPIDEGSSPEKPLAPRPNFFKYMRLLSEAGIIPEKLVLPTLIFSNLLPAEKFGK